MKLTVTGHVLNIRVKYCKQSVYAMRWMVQLSLENFNTRIHYLFSVIGTNP